MAKEENNTPENKDARLVVNGKDEVVNESAKRSYKDFTPMLGHILVTVPEEHKTKGGIVLPEGVEASDFQDLNIVVAVSSTVKDVQVGDGVYVGNGRITTITFKEGKYGVLRENQLMGFVRNND